MELRLNGLFRFGANLFKLAVKEYQSVQTVVPWPPLLESTEAPYIRFDGF
jgi:hypothetical protein